MVMSFLHGFPKFKGGFKGPSLWKNQKLESEPSSGQFSSGSWIRPAVILSLGAQLMHFEPPHSHIRKILVSVKFLSAILGAEMAAPILWTPGKMRPFCRKTSMSIKFLVLGGGIWGLGGGGVPIHFYGREDFSDYIQLSSTGWQSHPKSAEIGPRRPCGCCVAIWIAQLALLV